MKYLDLKLGQDEEAIVVAFDICSSTEVIEKLISRSELRRYTTLLGEIKHHLAKAQRGLPFVLYKFTGDGWILLFPLEDAQNQNIDGRRVLRFMHDFSMWFMRKFAEIVGKHLDIRPTIAGVKFGVDKGPLHRMTMYQRDEYIGRAIIVACRLQAAIKDRDRFPAYKALVTKSVFNSHLGPAKGFKVTEVRRKLPNIGGGAPFWCKKIELLKPRRKI